MDVGEIRIERDRPSNEVRRRIAAPGLLDERAEQLQRIGVARIERQRLAIKPLRLHQPAEPVPRDGAREEGGGALVAWRD